MALFVLILYRGIKMKNINGLDLETVELLKEKGLVNYKSDVKTKTIRQIVQGNFITLFKTIM